MLEGRILKKLCLALGKRLYMMMPILKKLKEIGVERNSTFSNIQSVHEYLQRLNVSQFSINNDSSNILDNISFVNEWYVIFFKSFSLFRNGQEEKSFRLVMQPSIYIFAFDLFLLVSLMTLILLVFLDFKSCLLFFFEVVSLFFELDFELKL